VVYIAVPAAVAIAALGIIGAYLRDRARRNRNRIWLPSDRPANLPVADVAL